MFFTFLLVVHALVAATLVGVILMQRSEGGGLGMGGSPAGLMSARGAADFLTRATTVLAAAFIGLSILLAFLAASQHAQTVDASAATAPARPPLTGPVAEPALGPTQPSAAAVAAAAAAADQANGTAPAPANGSAPANGGVPLAR